MRVEIVNETPRRIPRQRVHRVARRAEQLFGFPEHVFVQLILVTDKKMRRLNQQAFRKNRPTDVLAFPLHTMHPSPATFRSIPKDPDGTMRLGDIVISLPTAERQARQFRRSLSDEIARLFAHGILHLLGHDHVRPPEASRMEKLTIRLLA